MVKLPGNRLTRLLAPQPNQALNNGTALGGLAYALQSGLRGFAEGRDQRQQDAASQAFIKGLTGDRPAPGAEGPVRPGSIETALQGLTGLEGNPYATRLAADLYMRQAAQQREDALLNRRFEREDQQLEKKLAAQKDIAQYKAGLDVGNSPRFYTVPTSQGYISYDRYTGQASPVQLNGQQLMAPEGGLMPGPEGSMIPAGGYQQQGAPLLPPSIDPAAQGAVAAAKAQGQEEGKRVGTYPERAKAAFSAINELEAQQDVVLEDIDRAIQMAQNSRVGPDAASPLGVTGLGSVLSYIPGTDASDLASTLNTIKANVGFDKLQAMREASPTGGALGQVSERENTLLQSVLGALDQSQTQGQFVQNLQRLRDVLAQRREVRREAFQRDFGASFGGEQQPATQAPPAQGGWSIQRVE